MDSEQKITPFSHAYFMQQALQEANKAFEADEVPIGAVVVLDHRIIGRGFNQVETLRDATAHAEMIALSSAFEYLGSKYLPQASLYVTVEPCMMCSGALYWSRVKTIVIGAPDEKSGYLTQYSHPFFKKKEIVQGIMEEECKKLMQSFFQAKRQA